MTGIGRRREARERAFGLLYEAEAKSEAPATVLAGLPVEPDPYAARLVLGVDTRLDEIDALISRFAQGWKLERMPAVDRAVVRVAVYELLGEPTVPTAVVVSEAVELASQYSTDESGRFVNGLLARIATEVRGEAGPADAADRPSSTDAPDDGSPDGDAREARPNGRRARPPLPLPQPPLGDGVVLLRPWQPADAPVLAAAWADREVGRWCALPPSRSIVDARRWIAATPDLRERARSLDLAISSIGPRAAVLGEVGLSGFEDDGRAAIGYWVAADRRGRGYATRAVRLLASWAVGPLGLEAVCATVDPENRASIGVLRRSGFQPDGPTTWIYR